MSLSNSGHDENYRYNGGKAGDQTGTEWEVRSWYSYPWTHVIRHPDPEVREWIAKLAEEAAANNLIGYDQNQRTTYWNQLKLVGYRPSKIKVACEADCSAGVAANIKAVGYILNNSKLKNVSENNYTGSLRSALKSAGFSILTASKYLTSANYLLRGDILLAESGHTCTNLTNGSKSGAETTNGASSIATSTSVNKNVDVIVNKTIKIAINAKRQQYKAKNVNGNNYVEGRKFLETLGYKVGFDNNKKRVTVDGKLTLDIPTIIEDGTSYIHLRQCIDFLNNYDTFKFIQDKTVEYKASEDLIVIS